MSQQRESRLSYNIVKHLRALPNAHARKMHGGPMGTAGEPDIDAVIDGRAIKVEVKMPGRRATLTPQQQLALNRWDQAGAITGVVCSIDDMRGLLMLHDLVPGDLDDDEHARVMREVEWPPTKEDR